MKKTNQFPLIKTPRLILRAIEPSDAREILFLRSDDEVNRYIERPDNRKTKTLEDALSFIQTIHYNFQDGTAIAWGITLIDQPKIIGTICLWNFSHQGKHAEIGYDLSPKYQQRGIMTEALKSVLNYGFANLSLEKIEAYTHFQNRNSKRLLENNGFQLVLNKKDPDQSNNLIYELNK